MLLLGRPLRQHANEGKKKVLFNQQRSRARKTLLHETEVGLFARNYKLNVSFVWVTEYLEKKSFDFESIALKKSTTTRDA